jgi:hypothetical protein
METDVRRHLLWMPHAEGDDHSLVPAEQDYRAG